MLLKCYLIKIEEKQHSCINSVIHKVFIHSQQEPNLSFKHSSNFRHSKFPPNGFLFVKYYIFACEQKAVLISLALLGQVSTVQVHPIPSSYILQPRASQCIGHLFHKSDLCSQQYPIKDTHGRRRNHKSSRYSEYFSETKQTYQLNTVQHKIYLSPKQSCESQLSVQQKQNFDQCFLPMEILKPILHKRNT